MKRRPLFVLMTMIAACAADVEPEAAESPLRADSDMRDSLGRALGPLSAEIVRQNRSAERDLHLVARVEVRPNEVIEWYELGPGFVLVSGAGSPALGGEAYPMPSGDEDPGEVWMAVTNGAAMPLALREALDRQPERGTRQRPDSDRPNVEPDPQRDVPVPGASADLIPKHLGLGWCDTGYYTEAIPGYGTAQFGEILGACDRDYWDHEKCWDHISGTYAQSNDDCWKHQSNVCPYRGNIRMTIEADEGWISQGSFTVPQGGYRWKEFSDQQCDGDPFNDCPYVRIKVDQADGDGYQYRFLCRDGESL